MENLGQYLTSGEQALIEQYKKEHAFIVELIRDVKATGRLLPMSSISICQREQNRLINEISYFKGVAETRAKLRKGNPT